MKRVYINVVVVILVHILSNGLHHDDFTQMSSFSLPPSPHVPSPCAAGSLSSAVSIPFFFVTFPSSPLIASLPLNLLSSFAYTYTCVYVYMCTCIIYIHACIYIILILSSMHKRKHVAFV